MKKLLVLTALVLMVVDVYAHTNGSGRRWREDAGYGMFYDCLQVHVAFAKEEAAS